jgi:hypothetical protein
MRIPLLFSLILGGTARCESPPPTRDVPTQWTAVTATDLSLMESRLGLGTGDSHQLTAYTTMTFQAPPAPIDTMKIQCPQKVLTADEVKAFGLEAPYDTQALATQTDGVFEAPLAIVAPDAEAKYEGEFVVLRKGDQYLSLFPGKTQGKLLRPVTGGARIVNHRGTAGDRAWYGTQLQGELTQPLLLPSDTETIKVDLQTHWTIDPCQ